MKTPVVGGGSGSSSSNDGCYSMTTMTATFGVSSLPLFSHCSYGRSNFFFSHNSVFPPHAQNNIIDTRRRWRPQWWQHQPSMGLRQRARLCVTCIHLLCYWFIKCIARCVFPYTENRMKRNVNIENARDNKIDIKLKTNKRRRGTSERRRRRWQQQNAHSNKTESQYSLDTNTHIMCDYFMHSFYVGISHGVY